MWQSFIFGMHWKHRETLYYDELCAESMVEAADYFIDHKRDDVALVRVELIAPTNLASANTRTLRFPRSTH